jgi:hypothetical protein
LPDTPALRREQIKFQVALANALMHTKGYAASDTKESLNQARLLIERAEKIREPVRVVRVESCCAHTVRVLENCIFYISLVYEFSHRVDPDLTFWARS